ncbi:simple sugar transport system ATP-binding protein [Actinoalloteichus hoggarensis]|uniref:ABC transporter ATP-binding protein n=1 Tax=Actinoalloteichus hoggarensis TaxID=1470176 RepID=UPI00179AFD23|nr:ABC transporter ATP-binding protein [Actinoalloteichus hoggarensis]MBB5919074.1 simple sugar transport system ATP-binding protein [Actinoalloteichus hoggarensis]
MRDGEQPSGAEQPEPTGVPATTIDAAGGRPPAVVLRGITRRFPGVVANDGVDLRVEQGEIHALMGENGAGKSTLMSVLYGALRPDAGEIELFGRRVEPAGPAGAIAEGVGMVHQHFMLFPGLSVTENVVYGQEPVRRGLVDRTAARARVVELIDRFRLGLDPDARVRDLPLGVRQRVEILKLLYRDARVLILDEPTAVLTPDEVDRLFTVLRGLAAQGRSVILVTHKLGEVLAVSRTVTVLRDGRVAQVIPTAEATAARLASAMTGRDVELDVVHPPGSPGRTVLEVRELTVARRGGRPLVEGASFSVRAGEIVGIAGVAGNGQSELIEAIVGLRAASSGRVLLLDADVTRLRIAARRRAGLAYLPEDRGAVGSAPGASLAENLAAGHHRGSLRSRGGFLRPAALHAHAKRIVERFGVRAGDTRSPIRALSGGNQQKALLGREITREAPLLIVEQPTRGVDIAAVQAVHAELIACRDAGHAVLLVSAELSEIRGLSDRVLVCYEGRLVAELSRDEATEDRLGLAMAGDS